jgi:hypothetical protein
LSLDVLVVWGSWPFALILGLILVVIFVGLADAGDHGQPIGARALSLLFCGNSADGGISGLLSSGGSYMRDSFSSSKSTPRDKSGAENGRKTASRSAEEDFVMVLTFGLREKR